MKSGRLFWGVFFILIGLFVLLRHFLPSYLGLEVLWRFWPVVIVLIGLAILLKEHPLRIVLVVLAAVLLALLLTGLFGLVWDGEGDQIVGTSDAQEFSVAVRPETRSARLSLDVGASRTFVGGRTDRLFEASTVATVGEYRMTHTAAESSDAIDLDFRADRPHWRPWKVTNRADVRIHNGPLWEFVIDCGAAQLELDLRDHRVSSIDIDAGASSIDLTLGGGVPETLVRLDAGASSVDISVPSASGCEVHIDGGLTSKHLDGFEKAGSGRWETENYATAAEKILIDVNAGVSRINVRRR